MQINVSYDQSVSSLPAGLVSAVSYVVNYFDSLFTNPVTVNIDLGYGEIAGQTMGSGALGESETYVDSYAYSTVVNALKSNEPGASQQAAYATLPAASPVAGGTALVSSSAAPYATSKVPRPIMVTPNQPTRLISSQHKKPAIDHPMMANTIGGVAYRGHHETLITWPL